MSVQFPLVLPIQGKEASNDKEVDFAESQLVLCKLSTVKDQFVLTVIPS